jgi:hypothetical protein
MSRRMAGRVRDLVDKSIQPGEIEYLEPAEAVQDIERVTPRIRPKRQPSPWTVEPTPTSIRNEQSRRREIWPSHRDETPEPAAASPPSQRPARRELTDHELLQVQAQSAAGVLISADEHAVHKRFGAHSHGIMGHLDPRRG